MFEKIVVGTDGSARARNAVEVAAGLALAHGATLHIVQAYRPVAQMMASMASPEAAGVSMVTDHELEAQVTEQLDRLRSQLSDIPVETYPCAMAAAPAILSVADHQDADLIVVGSKGMHGARRVLGSVPNTIAHDAKCAVLIVPTG